VAQAQPRLSTQGITQGEVAGGTEKLVSRKRKGRVRSRRRGGKKESHQERVFRPWREVL